MREEWRKERKKEGGRDGGGTANHHLDVYFNFTVFGWHLKNSNLCVCESLFEHGLQGRSLEKCDIRCLTRATNVGEFDLETVLKKSQTSRVSHAAVYKYHT